MSFVFDEKKATNSLGETSWASGNRTGYLENFRASYDAMFASDRFDSENSIEKEYSLLVDHLNKKDTQNLAIQFTIMRMFLWDQKILEY